MRTDSLPDGEIRRLRGTAAGAKLSASMDFLRIILSVGLADPKMRGRFSRQDAAFAARLIQAAEIKTDDDRARLALTGSPI